MSGNLVVAGDTRNWEFSMSGKSELRMGLVAGVTLAGVAEMAEEPGPPNLRQTRRYISRFFLMHAVRDLGQHKWAQRV